MVETWFAILSLMLAANAVLDGWNIGCGIVSFVVALFIIRGMLVVITRRGYAPFGWLRIIIGGLGLALLTAKSMG